MLLLLYTLLSTRGSHSSKPNSHEFGERFKERRDTRSRLSVTRISPVHPEIQRTIRLILNHCGSREKSIVFVRCDAIPIEILFVEIMGLRLKYSGA